jgi:hypothetical protein
VFFTLTLLVRADRAIGRAAGRAEPEERGGRDDDALVSDGVETDRTLVLDLALLPRGTCNAQALTSSVRP